MTDLHNLDETTDEDHFRFQLDGKIYRMRYPNTEEITKLQKADEDERMKWIYGFITPEDKTAPPIDKALAKKNIKFLARFNNMVITEFGG